MKIYNSVGCSIDGVSEKEFEKFRKVGWITEEEYRGKHPTEFSQESQEADELNESFGVTE